MNELKPCPFCGATPVVLPKHPEIDGDAWANVHCPNPACPAQPHVSDGCNVSDDRGSDAYKALAIARWNQRTEQETDGG